MGNMPLTTITDLQELKAVVLKRNKGIAQEIFRHVGCWDFEQIAIKLTEIRENELQKLERGFDFSAIARVMACSKLLEMRLKTRNTEDKATVLEVSDEDVEMYLELAQALVENSLALKSLDNGLIMIKDGKIEASELGKKLYSRIAEFNVLMTVPPQNITKERFRERRRGHKKKPLMLYPILAINQELLIIRAINDLYGVLHVLSHEEQMTLLVLERMINSRRKEERGAGGLIIELHPETLEAKVAHKLSLFGYLESNGKIGSITFLKIRENADVVRYRVYPHNLRAICILLAGYNDENQKIKATYAENIADQIVKQASNWKTVEKNIEIPREGDKEGDTETEIDVLVKHQKKELYIVVEVKDFSFWKDYMLGAGIEQRKKLYFDAVQKLRFKVNWIKHEYNAKAVHGVIVTTIPEPFEEIDGTPLIYIAQFTEYLKAIEKKKDYRKRLRSKVRRKPYNAHVRRLQRIITSTQRIKEIESKKQSLYKRLRSLQRKQRALNEQRHELRMDKKALFTILESIKQEKETLLMRYDERKKIARKTRNPWFKQRYELEVISLKKQIKELEKKQNRLSHIIREKKKIDRQIKEKLERISEVWVEITSKLDELAEELWDARYLTAET